MPDHTPKLIPYGDEALLVQWPHSANYDPDITTKIHFIINHVQADPRWGTVWQDCVPGYDSLVLRFDPLAISLERVLSFIRSLLDTEINPQDTKGETLYIPVCYDAPYALDMEALQDTLSLTKAQIIKRHTQRVYTVCMMGFIPGFAFLSAVEPSLNHPRHTTPRLKVPAGSVGIANWQTGVYGLESPGGWQIIGRTPLTMFEANREPAFHLKAGQSVKFVPISQAEFTALQKEHAQKEHAQKKHSQKKHSQEKSIQRDTHA